MKFLNQIKTYRRNVLLLPALGMLLPGTIANAQTMVTPVVNANVAAVVAPVVTATVTAVAIPAVRVNPVVVPPVAPIVNSVVAPMVAPEVNVDIDPEINVNITGIDNYEGSWFATLKGDKIDIEFRSGDDNNNWSNSSDFMLSEFPSLPKNDKGEFSLKRDAGTIAFIGKFDDSVGFGHYKFTPDQGFSNYIKSTGVTDVNEHSAMSFFMVNLT